MPLMWITVIIGISMLLWVSTAWRLLGIFPILAYQFINGGAGYTHSMISTNYGIEIFPAKGRAAYFGFAKIFGGVCAMCAAVIAGFLMKYIEGFNFQCWGILFNHYHIFFACCALGATSSLVPLLIAGNKTVSEGNYKLPGDM